LITQKSKKGRDIAPAVSESELRTLVEGNNSLAFNLYRTIQDRDTNLFFSPFSIIMGLVMAYAGARKDTEKAMAESLKFHLSQDRLHPAFNYLDLHLTKLVHGATRNGGEVFKLHAVNTLWGQKGYKFLAQFLDTLAQNYGSDLRILDFTNEPEKSRVAINLWISDQTEDKIKDLVPEGVIDQLTRLILTNAIYFKAIWKYPFDASSTTEDIFHLTDGKDITVPMMKQTISFRYSEGDIYQAIELPYEGENLSLLILLPKIGQSNTFEENLDERLVKNIVRVLKPQEVALTLPRFQCNFNFSLKDTLSTLGMGIAFTGEADFSGMNSEHKLSIQDVLHQAFVAVDEAGTTAAAATAVIITTKFMRMLITEMKVDRPFVFLIRDIATESLLFLGRVLNPVR